MMLAVVNHFKEKKIPFSCRAQRVESGSSGCNVYVWVSTDERHTDWLMSSVSANATDYKFIHFQVGEAVVIAHTLESDLAKAIEGIFRRKHAMILADQAEDMIGKGEKRRAAGFIRGCLPDIETCPNATARAGCLLLCLGGEGGEREALALLDKAISRRNEAGSKLYYVWLALSGRGRLGEKAGELDKAQADFEDAAVCANSLGLRRKASSLLDVAAVEAAKGVGPRCIEIIAKALELESIFGARDCIGKIRGRHAFAGIIDSDAVKNLLVRYEPSEPSGFLQDPYRAKRRTVKESMLVVPPVVLCDGERNTAMEDSIEAGIMQHLGRRGVRIGSRIILKREGLDGIAEMLCRESGVEVRENGYFSLNAYSGSRPDLGMAVTSLVSRAFRLGAFTRTPELVAAASVNLRSAEQGGCEVAADFAVFRLDGMRIAAFRRSSLKSAEPDLRKMLKTLGGDLVKEFESRQ